MTIFEALLLGLVQGLTEFIPVSSSGHLLLAQEAFNNTNTLSFDVMLHVGTLAALVVYFWKDIILLVASVAKKNAQGRMARLIAMATLPAVIAGLLFGGFIDSQLRSPIVVVVTLSAVALLMLYAERRSTKEQNSNKQEIEIDTNKGLGIGVAQAVALVPGVSRSGITITVGMLMGLSRTQAARFSFLLAMPIIAGSAVGTYIEAGGIGFDAPLMIGMIIAFVSGIAAIHVLLGIIGKVGLKPFAYYRLVLAGIVLLFLV